MFQINQAVSTESIDKQPKSSTFPYSQSNTSTNLQNNHFTRTPVLDKNITWDQYTGSKL
jgi:hypothetical protein